MSISLIANRLESLDALLKLGHFFLQVHYQLIVITVFFYVDSGLEWVNLSV